MYVFWLFDLRVLLYVTAVGLRVSGLGSDVFFLVFRHEVSFSMLLGFF